MEIRNEDGRLHIRVFALSLIFSLFLFEKVPINELFTKNNYNLSVLEDPNQLKLFDL